MAAAGLTLLILCLLRMFLDIKGIAPIPKRNQVAWGLALILASCLMVLSILVALWRWAP